MKLARTIRLSTGCAGPIEEERAELEGFLLERLRDASFRAHEEVSHQNQGRRDRNARD